MKFAYLLIFIIALLIGSGCKNWPYIPGKMMKAPSTNNIHQAKS